MKKRIGICSLLALVAGSASAADLQGTWAAEPDGKGQIGHVEIMPCGPAYCGTIRSAFDKTGKPVMTENVGRQILRDVRQTGAGAYGDGKIYVPILGAEFDVGLMLQGDVLRVKACNSLKICRTQVWTRVP